MNWILIAPELALSVWIVVILLADLAIPAARKSLLWLIALIGPVLAGALLMVQAPRAVGDTLQAMFIVDQFSVFFKGLSVLTACCVILITRQCHAQFRQRVGAFYLLLLTAVLGMLVLASIHDLLMLFIGLELLTFPLYIMAAYVKTDARSIEAGMKYLIMGSVSAGFLVYGIALLYGFAGSTGFDTIHAALASGPVPLTAQAGLLLVLAALGFKVAAVPFHLWVPDVYEGAPTPVVALLSVGSKMAGIVAMTRLLLSVFPPLQELWAPLLAMLSAGTLLYGNLAAIPQTQIKRLIGYSSIGHAGYLLMGLSAGSQFGLQAVGYYLLAYLFSNLAVLLVVAAASDAIGGESLEAYRGLSKRSPFLAACMFIGLLSLAGVPPLGGFVGKLLVLLATIQQGRLWLVLVGAASVVVSLYYYLMVVKRMYLDAPSASGRISVDPLTGLTLAVLVLGILVIGIFPGPFVQCITNALRLG